MRDDFLLYYERELSFLRQMGVEFAEQFPRIAQRLLIEADKCDDPHVERIIESVAFLSARVHLKIDDEFPEITEALLSIIYPHYVRPVPSLSVVEMVPDPERGKMTAGLKISRGTPMYTRAVGGDPCRFRTCYDTTLWPVTIAEANYIPPDRLNPPIKSTEAVGSLRLLVQGNPDVDLSKLGMESLRFYLYGENKVIHTVYELLMNNCFQIHVRDPRNYRRRPTILPGTALRAVGFAEDEGLLPYPKRSFLAYRLIQEYFVFPEKFLFIDLNELGPIWKQGYKDQAEIVFLFSQFELEGRRQDLELGIKPTTFRLGCTPVINLFNQTCEPILMDQRKFEYTIIPDARRQQSTEMYSVEQVVSIDAQLKETKTYEPFYSYRHAANRDNKQTFWLSMRRQSEITKEEKMEMTISLVDLSKRVVHPDADTMTVRALCTNGDIPSRLPFGSETGDFTIEGMSALQKIVCLRRPTPVLRPAIGKPVFWRLVSHLSVNYLSVVEEGREALQEILKLYNFNNEVHTAKMIDGIVGLKSSRQFARVISENGISFARGIRTEIELDEEQFVGGGVFLFASVLEYFLGLYATLNSFSQLAVRTKQRKEVLREWLPRAGQRILM